MSDITERVQRKIDLGQPTDHLVEELLSEALSLEDEIKPLQDHVDCYELNHQDPPSWRESAYDALEDLSDSMSKKKIKIIQEFIDRSSE